MTKSDSGRASALKMFGTFPPFPASPTSVPREKFLPQ